MLIDMFLSPGAVQKTPLYAGQAFVQQILLLLAVICVPWLLCTKPYFIWKDMKKIQAQGYIGLGQDNGHRDSTDEALEGEEEGNGRAIAEDQDEDSVSQLANSDRNGC